MAEETISIIKVETGEAVKSVNDLKENIKTLKGQLGDLSIGTDEYQDTLQKLQVNQKALRDAMYATSSTMEEVAANAKGINVVFDENNQLINKENQSYNALVNTMAELKTQWRATSDEAKRAELGEQIKQINDELKSMDASVGNFSRSVGDYTNSVKKALGDFPSFADPAKKAIKGVNDTMSLLSQNPVMGVIALITPLVVKLTESIKEDEESLGAVKKIMDGMRPVMDFFQGVLGKVVDFLAQILSGVGDFLGNSGIFSKLVDGVVGVGNAIVKFVVAPFKGVIEAIKVFKEQGVKGLGNAARAFADEMKNGVAFRSNFQAGQAIAEGIMSGVKDKKAEVVETAASIGAEVGKEMGYNFQKEFDKALSEANRKFDEELRERLALQKELDAMTEEELARTNAEIEKYFQEQAVMRAIDEKDAEDKAKAKVAAMESVVSATSSILGTLSDLYDADAAESAKSANKVKALRIASATIDTISGAVTAFMQCVKTYGQPLGPIIGATQSAAVSAAGMAQIAKMRSTNISGASSMSPASVPAVVAAPAVQAAVPNVRNITSASEEQRLNYMAMDQKVVLVMSDLQKAEDQIRVQVDETTF